MPKGVKVGPPGVTDGVKVFEGVKVREAVGVMVGVGLGAKITGKSRLKANTTRITAATPTIAIAQDSRRRVEKLGISDISGSALVDSGIDGTSPVKRVRAMRAF